MPRRTMIFRPVNISKVSLHKDGLVIISAPHHVFDDSIDLECLELDLLVQIKGIEHLFAIEVLAGDSLHEEAQPKNWFDHLSLNRY
jgi:hypothetical protein